MGAEARAAEGVVNSALEEAIAAAAGAPPPRIERRAALHALSACPGPPERSQLS